MARIRLTGDQKRILLVLCDAYWRVGVRGGTPVQLRTIPATATEQEVRENVTAAALVRKGLAREIGWSPRAHGRDRRYAATLEGLDLHTSLKNADRLGKIPERRGGER